LTNWENKVKFINGRRMVGSDYDDDRGYGPEIIRNGSFTGGGEWNWSAPWTNVGGVIAHYDNLSTNYLGQSLINYRAGRSYKIEFDIAGGAGNKLMNIMGNGLQIFNEWAGSRIIPAGHYIEICNCILNGTVLRFYGDMASAVPWDLDNLSIREVF